MDGARGQRYRRRLIWRNLLLEPYGLPPRLRCWTNCCHQSGSDLFKSQQPGHCHTNRQGHFCWQRGGNRASGHLQQRLQVCHPIGDSLWWYRTNGHDCNNQLGCRCTGSRQDDLGHGNRIGIESDGACDHDDRGNIRSTAVIDLPVLLR